MRPVLICIEKSEKPNPAKPFCDGDVVTAIPDPADQAVAQSSAKEDSPVDSAQTEGNKPNTPPTPPIMEFVLADARHFQGKAEAPVTIVEFSDFK